MAKFNWTPEIVEFAKQTYLQHSLIETTAILSAKFNVDLRIAQVRSMFKNRGIKCGRITGQITKGRYRLMTPEQIDFVREKYKDLTVKELTAALNQHFGTTLAVSQVKTFVKNNKITCGRTGRFDKGKAPWNAGTKGLMKPNRASFKKGNRPHTWVPVGTIRETSGDRYLKIKVAEPNSWELLHRHLWERHFGPIPDGFMVVFRDGDRRNCVITNLMLRTREQSAVRNRWSPRDLPPELGPLVDAVADLRIAAAAAKRALKESRRSQR